MNERSTRAPDASAPTTRKSTRIELLRAAVTCIVSDGWQAASARNITTAAGVPLGAISYHFGSREALLVEAAMAEVEVMFRTPWAAVTQSRSLDDLLAGLLEWTRSPDVTPVQQALLLEVMAQSRRAPDVASALEAGLSAYRHSIAAALARVAQIPSGAVETIADALTAQANGLWLQTVLQPALDHDAAGRHASAAWRALLQVETAGEERSGG